MCGSDRGILEQDVLVRHIFETVTPPDAAKAFIRIGRVPKQKQAR